MVPAPLLLPPARPQRRQPAGARRARADRRLLARAGPERLPARRGPVPDRADGDAEGRDPGPARSCCATSAASWAAARRVDPARRGQPRRPASRRVLRRARRRAARHAVRVHRQPGAVPGARARGGGAAGRGARGAAADPARLPVGALRPQPRRADARQALGRASARRCSRRSGPSPSMQMYGRGLRRRLPAMLGGDQRRHAARLLADVLAARHAGAVLRRGDRDGGEPRDRGPLRGALADAVVRRAATAASRPRDEPCRPLVADGPVRLPARSTWRASGASPARC